MSQHPDQWPADKVRSTFLNYFKNIKGLEHQLEPSASVIPHNDTSLLFINSGMAPYKTIFQGTIEPSHRLANVKRIVDTQKCIRAGGKHNDLDDVGKDTYHHTFFEMLGNWSFGDYFKQEAITHAWTLLTKVYGLPADRLYITYFEGDESSGLKPDEEARQMWLDIGVMEDHIIPGNSKDNFWEMGTTGPCGPCSEIHYDRVGGRNASHLVNMDDPLVLEIWNLVFMQFNREEDASLRELPAKHIDTGMGFERLLSVMQDKSSNYDTDLFAPLFEKIQEMTGARPYSGKLGVEDVGEIDTAYRVVADHIRTLTFAMSDGGVPDKVNQGYVLRRILRRGCRYIRKKFDAPIGNFFSTLHPVLVAQMKEVFPEIADKAEEVRALLDEEERSFAKTLDRGEKLFEQYAKATEASGSTVLGGEKVWRLYDTYGFPDDLTEIMAAERGLTIDMEAYRAAEASSKEISKGGVKELETETIKLDVHDLNKLKADLQVPATDDSFKFTSPKISASVLAIYSKGKFLDSISSVRSENSFGILLNRTNFYAQSGGQEYDTGSISFDDGSHEFVVEDVQVYSGFVLHIGFLTGGSLSVGQAVNCEYDEQRRSTLRANHTATHILNYGLREVLGDHIDQKGSLVAPSKLRFDFSHKSIISLEDLCKIQDICDNWIKKDVIVYGLEMSLDEAQKIPGLRAVFGEAYPDPVRVVTLEFSASEIAKDISNPKWRQTSVEFCGGTHVSKTGDIELFLLKEQSSIASGIRRIVAVTGQAAAELAQEGNVLERRLTTISNLKGNAKHTQLKQYSTDINNSEIGLVKKLELQQQYMVMRKASDAEIKAEKAVAIKAISDRVEGALQSQGRFIGEVSLGSDSKAMQTLLNLGRNAQKPMYLFSVDERSGRVTHVNYLPSEYTSDNFNAQKWGEIVRESLGGKGGGKADTYIGSGPEISRLEDGILSAMNQLEITNK